MMEEGNEYDAQVLALRARFDHTFPSSNTPSDTSMVLLTVIKSNPTAACAEALAISTLNHALGSPRGVDPLAIAIKAVMDALQIDSLIIRDEFETSTFNHIFIRQLAEFTNDHLGETHLHAPKQTTITPTNSILQAALFCASAIKYGVFGRSNAMYAFARQGLQLPGADREPERSEAVAIGSCILLLVAGARMMDEWLAHSDGQDAVLAALEGLKERMVVVVPSGIRLLEKTIAVAGNGFSHGLSPEEAWGILFST